MKRRYGVERAMFDDAADNLLVELLDRARVGSIDAFGRLLEAFRPYLLLIARAEMDQRVMPKVAPSDAVQETFLEGQRDFPNFRGATPDDLKSWLRRILLNNIANWQRHYLATAKRCVQREGSLADSACFGADGDCLIADSTAPTARAIRNEESQRLEQALQRLSPNDRRVIELRHMEQLSFAEIGARTGRSADAARMSWWRALERLAGILENHDGGQHSPLSN